MKINNFIIFGDSYSTHRDFIPEEYPHFYCTEGRGDKEPVTKMLPNETWWGRLIEKTGAKLAYNDSWSGSTLGHTGYDGDCSHTSSFIYRYRKLCEERFFEKIDFDTVFVFGGTNDSWSDAPLGEMQLSDWCENDLFFVLPAICYFMNCLKSDFPDKQIVFIANYGIKPEIIECMRAAAAKLDVSFVRLSDIDKLSNHPTILGMQEIADQIIDQLGC